MRDTWAVQFGSLQLRQAAGVARWSAGSCLGKRKRAVAGGRCMLYTSAYLYALWRQAEEKGRRRRLTMLYASNHEKLCRKNASTPLSKENIRKEKKRKTTKQISEHALIYM